MKKLPSVMCQCKYVLVFLQLFYFIRVGGVRWENDIYLNNDYRMLWTIVDGRDVIFEIQVRTLGYVGLGFSWDGQLRGSDMAIGWVHQGQTYFQDRHVKRNGDDMEPVVDPSQDYVLIEGYENVTHTVMRFKRKLDTCDTSYDIPISNDTMRVIYMYHNSEPKRGSVIPGNLEQPELAYRGYRSLFLTQKPHQPQQTDIDPNQKTMELRNQDVELPQGDDTLYWCKMFKLQDINQKSHVIKYEPVFDSPMSKPFMQHIILYECQGATPELELMSREPGRQCYRPNTPPLACNAIVATWAKGSEGFTFPPQAGYALDTNQARFYLMETHYNNPKSLSTGGIGSGGGSGTGGGSVGGGGSGDNDGGYGGIGANGIRGNHVGGNGGNNANVDDVTTRSEIGGGVGSSRDDRNENNQIIGVNERQKADSSGLKLYYTTNLRKHDAGVLSIGMDPNWRHIIPPYQKHVVSEGHCIEDCTRRAFPSQGISIFAVMMRTHLIGKEIKLRHQRHDTEFSPIAQDRNLDPAYQEYRRLPTNVRVQQGDRLIAQCIYDSSGRDQITLGGPTTREESCIVLTYYYPRQLRLTTCHSLPSLPTVLHSLGIQELAMGSNPVLIASPPELASMTLESRLVTYDWKNQFNSFQQVTRRGSFKAICWDAKNTLISGTESIEGHNLNITHPWKPVQSECLSKNNGKYRQRQQQQDQQQHHSTDNNNRSSNRRGGGGGGSSGGNSGRRGGSYIGDDGETIIVDGSDLSINRGEYNNNGDYNDDDDGGGGDSSNIIEGAARSKVSRSSASATETMGLSGSSGLSSQHRWRWLWHNGGGGSSSQHLVVCLGVTIFTLILIL